MDERRTMSSSNRKIGCGGVSIITIIIIVIATLSKVNYASQQIQYQASLPKFDVILNCQSCANGIPIYDSWSEDRQVVAYGRNGETCSVSHNYTYSEILTLQPNASYKYIDTQPRLYVHCDSGNGFVYTSQTNLLQ
jgi:hypothetical protein